MTPPKLRRLLWAQALIIALLAAALLHFGRDNGGGAGGGEREKAAVVAPTRVASEAGVSVVRIPMASQRAGGIGTAVAVAMVWRTPSEAYGVVVDPQPLLQLHARYLAARAEQRAAAAALQRAEAERRRMQVLFADERNASQRAVEAAEADAAAARGRAEAAGASLAGLEAQALHEWGKTVAAWACQEHSPEFDGIAARREALVQIAVRPDQDATRAATLAVLGGDGRPPLPARPVSAAPRGDPLLAGVGYFYRAAAASLPVGARVLARLEQPGEGRRGVRLPGSAVVWHAGKPWVYLRRDGERFERRDVSGAEPVGDDWFVTAVDAGAQVVTAGAQVLLSEELRYQIKNENED